MIHLNYLNVTQDFSWKMFPSPCLGRACVLTVFTVVFLETGTRISLKMAKRYTYSLCLISSTGCLKKGVSINSSILKNNQNCDFQFNIQFCKLIWYKIWLFSSWANMGNCDLIHINLYIYHYVQCTIFDFIHYHLYPLDRTIIYKYMFSFNYHTCSVFVQVYTSLMLQADKRKVVLNQQQEAQGP